MFFFLFCNLCQLNANIYGAHLQEFTYDVNVFIFLWLFMIFYKGVVGGEDVCMCVRMYKSPVGIWFVCVYTVLFNLYIELCVLSSSMHCTLLLF